MEQDAQAQAQGQGQGQDVLKKKFSLTLVIPTDVVGLLIGKQGATLREMSAASGARMSFQAFSDMPPRNKVML
jgi:hypothetical protein